MLKGKDLLSIHDLSQDEYAEILATAAKLKMELKAGVPHPILKGKTLGMIFEKSSTRTRVSFETGIYQLGGQGLFLSNKDIQLGRGEPVKDTARVLSRYIDGIMIRTFKQSEVEEFAKYADIPVINGLTDLLHPCQILADMLTIHEYKGKDLKGLHFAYIGDGNNMANSYLFGCAKEGIHCTIACPKGYEPNAEVLAKAQEDAKSTGAVLKIVEDPAEAAKDADVLATDTWTSMGEEAEHAIREKVFQGYQINDDLLAIADKTAIVMHCLPAYRGLEITEKVLEKFAHVIFDEAENRLHAQKAVMALTMCD